MPLIELPAINPNGHKWLPKEKWLADFRKIEKQQGRKVLVYVTQTGTRDIQDRGASAAPSHWDQTGRHPGNQF